MIVDLSCFRQNRQIVGQGFPSQWGHFVTSELICEPQSAHGIKIAIPIWPPGGHSIGPKAETLTDLRAVVEKECRPCRLEKFQRCFKTPVQYGAL
jgi:hypothetical protein